RELHESEGQGPSEDDLMAIADAVREVARNHQEQPSESTSPQVSQVGRRGHLRAVPS
ncbi:MAG: hypothetical protein RIQ92_592, partial [Actinomycetota bacterium]